MIMNLLRKTIMTGHPECRYITFVDGHGKGHFLLHDLFDGRERACHCILKWRAGADPARDDPREKIWAWFHEKRIDGKDQCFEELWNDPKTKMMPTIAEGDTYTHMFEE